MAEGHHPESRTAQPDLVISPTSRMRLTQHREVCGVWRPTALRLSAPFPCPDLSTMLLVYREKCTQRLRPRQGGKGQLTCKVLLSLHHLQKSQMRVCPNGTEISGASPQLGSELATWTQCLLGVNVLLLWSSSLCNLR